MREVSGYVTHCSQEFKKKRRETAFFVEVAKTLTLVGVPIPLDKKNGISEIACSRGF
jgi:hypothetical protein